MGFSTPALRKNGYNPTDDVMHLDTTTYQTTDTSYTEVISGKMIESVAPGSVVRFKIDIRIQTVANTGTMRLKIDGNVVWTESTNSTSYSTRTQDIDISSYLRETPITVEIKSGGGGSVFQVKNFSLCGKQSPFVF